MSWIEAARVLGVTPASPGGWSPDEGLPPNETEAEYAANIEARARDAVLMAALRMEEPRPVAVLVMFLVVHPNGDREISTRLVGDDPEERDGLLRYVATRYGRGGS